MSAADLITSLRSKAIHCSTPHPSFTAAQVPRQVKVSQRQSQDSIDPTFSSTQRLGAHETKSMAILDRALQWHCDRDTCLRWKSGVASRGENVGSASRLSMRGPTPSAVAQRSGNDEEWDKLLIRFALQLAMIVPETMAPGTKYNLGACSPVRGSLLVEIVTRASDLISAAQSYEALLRLGHINQPEITDGQVYCNLNALA